MKKMTRAWAALLPDILAHAAQEQPRECCGLLVRKNRRTRYWPCRNRASEIEHFVIDASDYAQAQDCGEIVAIVHSHVHVPAQPSAADWVGIKKSNLPWLIVNWPTGAWTLTDPQGDAPDVPLEGREFVHGVHDCYSLVRDYYRTLGIELRDYPRQGNWWLEGISLYRDNFAAEGFIEVPWDSLQPHDALLMRVRSPVTENHAAIYLGDNTILHHLMHSLSCKTYYEAYWQRHTTAVLRHKSLMP